MILIDTHCHIHESDFPLDRSETLAAAQAAGVEKIICVGTNMTSSRDVVNFAKNHNCHPERSEGSLRNTGDSSSTTQNDKVHIFAIIGIHPHEAQNSLADSFAGPGPAKELESILAGPGPAKEIVGVGEIGLDYFYEYSPREAQIEILNQQIELALKYDLPINFHVRDAFDDFWPIFDGFGGKIRGVLHSYTDNIANMEKALTRGLFIGVNGIATFNREPDLLAVHKKLPLDRMLLETDAPYLAPVPFRGRPNQPSYIPKIVEFLSELRGETPARIAKQTTANAEKLFHI
ncbi:TatD family hydrolase [Candidatus Saccharibacteria bacterium]|nr:TatD family hydrolase [Candidatus Saccharibacteria bacterium]